MTHKSGNDPERSNADDTGDERPDVEIPSPDEPAIGEELDDELDDSADSYVSPARTGAHP